MRAVSLFAGVGGFDLALERAGIEVVAAVEIDPKARAVLARRFPTTRLYEDVTTVTGEELSGGARVDVLCGGWPCQDLSVAGRRAGLAGQRSGLFSHVVRLADELRPTWLLLENVPGLLSSNGGRDMGAVLGALGELGYGVAYRVLDARYFGVPQRRRRVIFVGHPRIERAVEVLFEPESGSGHPAPSRKPGEGSASCSGGGVAATLNSGGNSGGFRTEPGEHIVRVGGDFDDPTYTLQEEAFLAANPMSDRVNMVLEEPITVRLDNTNSWGDPVNESGVVEALRGGAGKVEQAVLEPSRWLADGAGVVDPIVMAPSFSKRPGQQIATRDDGTSFAVTTGEPPRVLTNTGGKTALGMSLPGVPPVTGSNGNPGIVFAQNQRDEVRIRPEFGALAARPGGQKGQDFLSQGATLRRLTPLECERLQGFPDGWTEGQADSTRYRMLGNAVCVNVIQWVANRLAASEGGQV